MTRTLFKGVGSVGERERGQMRSEVNRDKGRDQTASWIKERASASDLGDSARSPLGIAVIKNGVIPTVMEVRQKKKIGRKPRCKKLGEKGTHIKTGRQRAEGTARHIKRKAARQRQNQSSKEENTVTQRRIAEERRLPRPDFGVCVAEPRIGKVKKNLNKVTKNGATE